MKHYGSSVAVAFIVVLGYSTGNYGAGFVASPNLNATQNSTASISASNYGGGFVGSPSVLAITQSQTNSANYGGGFTAAPNLNSSSGYQLRSRTSVGYYGAGFAQSPPAWYGYQGYLTFW